MKKHKIEITLDIIAVIITLCGCGYLFLTSKWTERILILVLIFLVVGYIFIIKKILPQKIHINNVQREQEKRLELEDFLEKTKEEIDNIDNLYSYLKKLQENLLYVHIFLEKYGLKNKLQFINKDFSYIKIAIQLKELFDIKTTPVILTKEDKIIEIILNCDKYTIKIKPQEITMATKISKENNSKEQKEFTEKEMEEILKKRLLS